MLRTDHMGRMSLDEIYKNFERKGKVVLLGDYTLKMVMLTQHYLSVLETQLYLENMMNSCGYTKSLKKKVLG